jgi:REP element-mobilizing transposase RayT
VAVRDRRPVFADARVAAVTVAVLRTHAEKTGVPIYAYCVMLDHLHLVLGPSQSCDVVAFVGQFKNLALRAAWRFGVRRSFWQRSFYDHFLRAEEQLERVVDYVLDNPVRGGLVARRGDYPFSGSLVFSL